MIIRLGREAAEIAAEGVQRRREATALRQLRQPYARPPAEDVEAALEEAGGRVAVAAPRLGVHRATLYRWIERDPDLAAAVRAAIRAAIQAREAEHT